ncbi:zinc-binding dehydrogenase [Neobacillus niacini]|uniref:zinc-binding dehydrogenase n=1 Tax=Neobacillus niacini TaxID=86668 RepID=UPI002FFE1728
MILRDIVKPGEKMAGLFYEDIEIPRPGPNEILIRLNTAAINRRDVFIRLGLYPNIQVPSIVGSDGAGIVSELGSDVKEFKLGDEVVINPTINWGENPDVHSSSFSVLGLPLDGTYSQYIKIPSENVFPKPKHLSWEESAAIPLAGITAYRAIVSKGEVKAGDSVIIPGIGGGVATFALQIAAAKGAKVYVTSSSDEKLEKAMKLGAAGGINYRSKDWVKKLKEMSGGADLSIDSIGGETFNELISLAKPGSRIVTLGATLGPVSNLVMPRIFMKQLKIMGTMMGNPKEFSAMLKLYENNNLKPSIDMVYPLEEVDSAHKRMYDGKHFGKIILNIPS